jgi:pyridoxamine 5'-phosphate oxidase-like protein
VVLMLTDLSRGESLWLLGSVSAGRIVFTQHAMPAIRLVNHMLDGADIIIRTPPGAAVVSAADNAQGVVVAYEVDAVSPRGHLGWSVVVVGTAYLVRNPGEVARYQQALSLWVASEMDQVIRIRPGIVTGFRLDGDVGIDSTPGS